MEFGGDSAGSPDPDSLTEASVEQLGVPRPGLGHGLLVLEAAELTRKHRDEDHQVCREPGNVQLGECLEELSEPRHLIPDLGVHQRQHLLQAEGGGRGPGPSDGGGLGGVEVNTGEDDADHHVGLKRETSFKLLILKLLLLPHKAQLDHPMIGS